MKLELIVLVILLSVVSAHGLMSRVSVLAFTKGVVSSNTNLHSVKEKDETEVKNTEDLDETVRKQGLEVGLWKAFRSKDTNGVKPGDLLKKYGSAYLATSISLAIVSYGLCYVLVSNGVDVGALLQKVGIKASTSASNAGTAAVAYAIHKAASPIRFPPTVVLTPMVAELLGKKPNEEGAKA
jgi:hypothetical protein